MPNNLKNSRGKCRINNKLCISIEANIMCLIMITVKWFQISAEQSQVGKTIMICYLTKERVEA